MAYLIIAACSTIDIYDTAKRHKANAPVNPWGETFARRIKHLITAATVAVVATALLDAEARGATRWRRKSR